MALHPGEQGHCEKHGRFDEYCCDCTDTVRVVYETRITPAARLAEKCEMHFHMMPDGRCSCPAPEAPIFFSWPKTVSEMRDHLVRVDMFKEYLHRAVEARMSAESTETQVVALLGSSFAGVADEVHATIKRLSGGEQKISDAEAERLMNYAQTGRKGNL